MKKRILSILLVVAMLAVMIPAFAVASSAETTVTDWDAEVITLMNADDFKAFHDQIHTKGKGAFHGQTVKLGADIDMTGYTFTMFTADEANGYVGFAGIFDGQFHTLSGITAKSAANCTGFFGNPGNPTDVVVDVWIKNLALVNTTITGNDCGVFYGMVNAKVTFENVYNAATISGTGHNAGFIESTRWGSPDVEFINCVFDGTVKGSNYQASGFIGGNLMNGAGKDAPVFTNCLVTGNIYNGSSVYAGGYKFLGNASKETTATYNDCIQFNSYYQTDAAGQTYAVCPKLVGLGSGFAAFDNLAAEDIPAGYTVLNTGYPVPTTLLPFFAGKVNGTAAAEGVTTKYAGYQDNGSMTALRLIGLVKGEESAFSSVGFEIVAVGPTGVTVSFVDDITNVYTSVETAAGTKTAEELGGSYIFVTEIGGIKPNAGVATFAVKTYSVDADGNKTYTDMVVVSLDTTVAN